MLTPFVQLFHTPNSAYLLDVNKNEFISINEQSYQYLHVLFAKQDVSQFPIPQELTDYKKNGYLATESAVEHVNHIYTEFLSHFLSRKLSKVALQLTQNCNFRCKYCIYSENSSVHQRNHSAKRMSWNTAKKAIDFLWQHSIDSQKVNVGFYGGEPLLEFPLIVRIIEYALDRFRGKTISFSMTTNGTMLNDDIIRFLDEHNISLTISLDGPKEINDKNRVFADGSGTFDTVMERLNRIKKIAPEYAQKTSISMVINPAEDFDCVNSICIPGAEFDMLSVHPSLVDQGYDDKSPEFSEEYVWKLRYQQFLAILSHVGRFPKTALSPIAEQAIASSIKICSNLTNAPGLHSVDAPGGPCIPGQFRLFVNVDEQLFPCERVSEKSDAMNIGALDTGFSLEKVINILNVGSLTESVCKKCWCFKYCSICAKKADNESEQLSDKKKLSHCSEVKSDVYAKLRMYLLLKEISMFYPMQVKQSE